MSPYQSYRLPNYESHPEFGYLWPSHQVWQRVRVGLAAAAFGLVTGLAGAMALLPRHGASAALTTPVLAVAPASSTRDLALVPASSPVAPDKQFAPATPITPPAGTTNEPSAAIQSPAPPAVPTVSGMTTVEHVRTETTKKPRKKAKAIARPRGRESSPTEALAASPFSFETRRFSDGGRSTWRRDRGSNWFW